jgi:hypothetical protein
VRHYMGEFLLGNAPRRRASRSVEAEFIAHRGDAASIPRLSASGPDGGGAPSPLPRPRVLPVPARYAVRKLIVGGLVLAEWHQPKCGFCATRHLCRVPWILYPYVLSEEPLDIKRPWTHDGVADSSCPWRSVLQVRAV